MKIKILDKRGFQISFAWLFAIIVGGFIIFLAIFAAVKLMGTEQEISSAETGKELEILTNVLETGFESSKTASLEIPLETRIKNNCQEPNSFEPFGIQGLQVAQKSLNRWSEIGTEIVFRNRYIFSEDVTEGKKFHMFSKSFDFPFKVSDVIYLTSSEENYCFVGLEDSSEIKREISNLNQKNLFVEGCPSSSINICFDDFGTQCDVEVNLNQKYVEKENKEGEIEKVYFETDSLMYGAIFSEKNIYECQVKRIMQRLSELSQIYSEKESLLSEKQSCPRSGEILNLAATANSFTDSSNLITVKKVAESVDKVNGRAICKLWWAKK